MRSLMRVDAAWILSSDSSCRKSNIGGGGKGGGLISLVWVRGGRGGGWEGEQEGEGESQEKEGVSTVS